MTQRVALVTGGMGGLGEAICIKLSKMGYTVVTTYSPGNKKSGEWLEEMKKQGYAFRAVPVVGNELPTRAFVVDATIGTDFTPGPLQQTARELDVAIQGKGWLAVQTADGGEAYTRHGSLKLSENGQLQTQRGDAVLGDGGPISVPPNTQIAIAKDGTITGMVPNQPPSVLGRMKLVNPAEDTLVRGTDGLFRTKDGNAADADANVNVIGGTLEGSNVNTVDAMVTMISLARQFEMQMTLMKNAESNETKASQLLALN